MKMQIYKQFTFDAAHYLPNVPDGHKCKEIHGHTYHLTVFIEGDLDPQLGWVMDFAVLKSVVEPLVKHLDHKFINNLEGFENPTCENMVLWFWNQIKPKLPQLCKIELKETPTSGAVYEGK